MANIGRIDDKVAERIVAVKGEHGLSNNSQAVEFLLDFYYTLRDQGALQQFDDNAKSLKAAIFALSPQPMLRQLQIKTLRKALDEAERGTQ